MGKKVHPETECRKIPRQVCIPTNCVKVPKEICVNTKSNPRRVKKPVVKQWCYNPKDLNDLRASNIVPNEVTSDDGSLPGETGRAAQNIFARISKLLFNKRR